MHPIFEWCYRQDLSFWCLISVAANILVFGASVIGCWLCSRLFQRNAIFDAPQPITTSDIVTSIAAIVLNSGITVVGWLLWKQGWITILPASYFRTALDTLVLLMLMDLTMYGFHWIAHRPILFWLVHQSHHAHQSTNPLSLFVLNPFEVLGFGFLLISALLLFPFSEGAVVAYLTLNIVFGTIGHLGVEPIPRQLARFAMFRHLGSSTFHGMHHADKSHNFGFYTTLWDRLFNTLHPEYDARFGSVRLAKELNGAESPRSVS